MGFLPAFRSRFHTPLGADAPRVGPVGERHAHLVQAFPPQREGPSVQCHRSKRKRPQEVGGEEVVRVRSEEGTMDRSSEEEESPSLLPQPTVRRSNPIDANRTTKATVEETRKSQLQQGHDPLDHCPWREMAVRMPPLVQAHQRRTQAKGWSRIVQPSPMRSNHGEGQSDGTEKVRHETRDP